MRIFIDHREIEAAGGMSVMEAAETAGIRIPSMCFMKGYSNHPSCMICMVEDEITGNLFPSCAMPVAENMRVITKSDAVVRARREALELLLSDHRGDCDPPCRTACPAFMNIPMMNRLISKGDFAMALRVVREEIAIPLVLGYICDAPCEKACHRRTIDGAVAICSVKLYTALNGNYLEDLPLVKARTGQKVLVVGAGPAGLSAAFYLLIEGHDTDIADERVMPGGSLLDIPEDKLPSDAVGKETDVIKKLKGNFILNRKIRKDEMNEILQHYDAVIIATGVSGDLYESEHNKIIKCITSSGGLAVKASAIGKEAAGKVNDILSDNKNIVRKLHFNSHAGKLSPEDQAEYLKECPEAKPVSTDKAVEEAARCMHCDCRKADNCKLRIYSDEYNASRMRFRPEMKKTIRKELQHDLLAYEPQKCIRCGLCVEISSSDPSSAGMAFFGRGYDVEVVPALNSAFNYALKDIAMKCADACPTGALSLKERLI